MDSINFARLQQLGDSLVPKAGEASLEEIQEQRRQDEAAEAARQARNEKFLREIQSYVSRSLMFEDAQAYQELVHYRDFDMTFQSEMKEIAEELDSGADPELVLTQWQNRQDDARRNLDRAKWLRYRELQDKVNKF